MPGTGTESMYQCLEVSPPLWSRLIAIQYLKDIPFTGRSVETSLFNLQPSTNQNFFFSLWSNINTWKCLPWYSTYVLNVLQIVNNHLQSGQFPQALMTAVIKPLLKKPNLDASGFCKYRPISNLPFLGKSLTGLFFNRFTVLWCKTVFLMHFSLDFDHTTALRRHLLKF